jgi:MoxR-like ATPase
MSAAASPARDSILAIERALCESVLGAEAPARLLAAALLADGHALIEGPPGVGKTSLAAGLATLIGGDFRRVQFTPDLLPADILGYSIYHQGRGEFDFLPGPVFGNVLLADEINRTSPRIQSALLECMNERQVTVDGKTRPLARPFMVIATQNNLEDAGTFPLPAAQLDRFLVSINVEPPDLATQADIVKLHASSGNAAPVEGMTAPDQIRAAQEETRAIPASDAICEYIARICHATRTRPGMAPGVSPRGSVALLRAAQAVAYLECHSAIFPEDVKFAAPAVLGHRIGAALGGQSSPAPGAVADLLDEVEAP